MTNTIISSVYDKINSVIKSLVRNMFGNPKLEEVNCLLINLEPRNAFCILLGHQSFKVLSQTKCGEVHRNSPIISGKGYIW